MGSWNEKYLGVKCEQDKLDIISKILDCLDIKTLDGGLDAPGVSVPYEVKENERFDLTNSSYFKSSKNFFDKPNYKTLDELFNIINKYIGETAFFYNQGQGNNTSDDYESWEIKMDPHKSSNNICHTEGGPHLFEEYEEEDLNEDEELVKKSSKIRTETDTGLRNKIVEVAKKKGYSDIIILLECDNTAKDNNYSEKESEKKDDDCIKGDISCFRIEDGAIIEYTGQKDISSVTIPNGVTCIRSYAFFGSKVQCQYQMSPNLVPFKSQFSPTLLPPIPPLVFLHITVCRHNLFHNNVH